MKFFLILSSFLTSSIFALPDEIRLPLKSTKWNVDNNGIVHLTPPNQKNIEINLQGKQGFYKTPKSSLYFSVSHKNNSTSYLESIDEGYTYARLDRSKNLEQYSECFRSDNELSVSCYHLTKDICKILLKNFDDVQKAVECSNVINRLASISKILAPHIEQSDKDVAATVIESGKFIKGINSKPLNSFEMKAPSTVDSTNYQIGINVCKMYFKAAGNNSTKKTPTTKSSKATKQ